MPDDDEAMLAEALLLSPEIRQLKETLHRSDVVASEIVSLLEGFESRLSRLETVVAPIHQQTKALTTLSGNLEGTVSQLSVVLSYFQLAEMSRSLVTQASVRDKADAILAQLDRLDEAVVFLSSSRIQGGDRITAQLRDLHRQGLDRVKSELRVLLDEAAPSVADAIDRLEQARFGRGSSATLTSPTGAPSSPRSGSRQVYLVDTEALPLVCHLIGYLGESACEAIFVSARSQFIDRVVASLTSLAFPSDDTSYERGTGPFVTYLRRLVRLLRLEMELVEYVLPSNPSAVFARLLVPVIQSLSTASDSFSGRVKRGVVAHEYRDLLSLFDLLASAREPQQDLERLLTYCGRNESEISELTERLRKVASGAFRDLMGDARRPLKASSQPADSTVHETTSHLVGFLQRLVTYRGSVDLLLPPPHSGALAIYVLDLLDALWANLETLAQAYKKPIQAAVFLINNCHYMQRFIRDPPTLALVGKDAEATYAERIAAQLEDYQACWKGVIENILEVNAGRAGSSSSSKKVKEKLTHFNREVEEMRLVHLALSVPDRELRKQIRRLLAGVICPLYEQFYDRHAKSDFTKNPEKYLKYQPADLEALLNSLFESA